MRYKSVEYMEWVKTRTPAAFDLTKSSVRNMQLAELDLDLSALELTGNNAYGYPPLMEKIAGCYGVETDCVVSTLGTSHALYLVCAALCGMGDRVLVEDPAYEPLLAVPRSFSAKLARLTRRFGDGFKLIPELVEEELKEKTRLIILTNIHNPSGAWNDPLSLEKIFLMAERAGSMVLIDEVYLDFMMPPKNASSFHLGNNVIVISSLTKVYGLGGLRCGWIIAPSVMAAELRRIVDHINVEGAYVGDLISDAVWEKKELIRLNLRETIRSNHQIVKDWVESEPGLSWHEPDGGVVCFPRIETGQTGSELEAVLRRDHDTGIVPGRFFGREKHFRLGFGGSDDILKQALFHIHSAL